MEGPGVKLEEISQKTNLDVQSKEFARYMDENDPLKTFREKFQYPKKAQLPLGIGDTLGEDKDCIYFCGNSLGLKPKMADEYMKEQMEKWGQMGVFMHFDGPMGAAVCDQPGKAATATLVGAKFPHEVAIMNGLTVNLHLMMLAFYRPTEKRFKILIEDHAFPSDRYAMNSLIEYNGLNPEDVLIQIKPKEGEETLRTIDILKTIQDEGDSIAVVILSGLQYYTGQKFDIEAITKAAKNKGCNVGWDLAHAIGNVELKLHEWNVDFAVWCTYKYLNSGAGGIAGAFLHDKYANDPPRHLAGWWSNNQETRFKMAPKVDYARGADSFRLCNPPPWLACLNLASLEIFEEAGMDRILAKQFLITGYLEYLLLKNFAPTMNGHGPVSDKVTVRIITPAEPKERGSQLSLVFSSNVVEAYKELERNGIVCDFRYPSVIRIAPAPLYNSFFDVFRFIEILKRELIK